MLSASKRAERVEACWRVEAYPLRVDCPKREPPEKQQFQMRRRCARLWCQEIQHLSHAIIESSGAAMKHQAIIDRMALEEKVALCSGADTFRTKAFEEHGIPGITLADGPHGLRKQVAASDRLGLNASVPATCFPHRKPGRLFLGQGAACTKWARPSGRRRCRKASPSCWARASTSSGTPCAGGISSTSPRIPA